MQNNKKNLCTFYIVRHGETEWNVKKIIQGQRNVPLNKNGEKQAVEVAKKLKHTQFRAIFSSDLARAKSTAEIIAQKHNLSVITNVLLREKKLGQFEGKSTQLLKIMNKEYEKLTKNKRIQYKLRFNIEDNDDLIKRCIKFFKETALTHKGNKVLVVTHAGLMRVLLIHLGMVIQYGGIKNGEYIKLISNGNDLSIVKSKEFFFKRKNDVDIDHVFSE
ncbi:MAG: histidine phosphatase family protein [Patescibacteria group bacterium]